MRRALLRNVSLYTRSSIVSQTLSNPCSRLSTPLASFSSSAPFRLRFFSSESDSSTDNPDSAPSLAEQAQKEKISTAVQDVSNKELDTQLQKYFKLGEEEALPEIVESIMKRKLTKKHEETDDELLDELEPDFLDVDVDDKQFESDFDELYKTDTELDDLYNAKEHIMQKMAKDEFFNMDSKKWDDMIKEATDQGFLNDTRECEEILEDMLSWDKLLPDDLKKKVEAKFNELGDMCERGEIEPEAAYELFKEFEDEMVMEYGKIMEEEGPPNFDDTAPPDNKKHSDDPPGEGPILRWRTRVVFSPGGDQWHPKNRKVKMSVTVKELGLSKPQFHRLRDLVGKRYHPGKDELTITSERYEYREENRKDCLRTLFSLIEEAGKARKLAHEARTSYVKERLRANPAFMERLRAKIQTNTVSA